MPNDFTDLLFKTLATVGGIGVIIIGVFKFFGNIVQDRLKEQARVKSEIEIENFRQQLGLSRVRADRFANAQFVAYDELWKSLQALRKAGDALWGKANEANLKAFARQLRQTRTKIDEGEIYFEDRDYEKLQYLFRAFESFGFGKTKLRNIRTNTHLPASSREIALVIEDNRERKEEYEKMLNEVKVSFKNRLSRLEQEEVA